MEKESNTVIDSRAQRLATLLREAQGTGVWSFEEFLSTVKEVKEASTEQLARAYLIVMLEKFQVTLKVKELERNGLANLLAYLKAGGSVH